MLPIILLSGCDAYKEKEYYSHITNMVEYMENKWDKKSISQYDFRLTVIKYSDEVNSINLSTDIVVSNSNDLSHDAFNQGYSVEDEDFLVKYIMTIDEYFELIKDYINKKSQYIYIHYDDNYFYPERIDILETEENPKERIELNINYFTKNP